MNLISFAPRKASDNSRAAAAARIKDWATNEFASAGFSVNNDSARLMVSEVECMMPDCVPVETVIVLLREGHAATKTKILYPMSQVQRSHVRGAAFSLAASERLRDALSRELNDLSSKLTTPAGRPPFGGANPVQGGLAEDPQHALQVLEQLGFALQKHDEAIRPKFLAQYGDILRTGEEKGKAGDGAAKGGGQHSAALQASPPSIVTSPATTAPMHTSPAAPQEPSPTPQQSMEPARQPTEMHAIPKPPPSTFSTAINGPSSSAAVSATAPAASASSAAVSATAPAASASIHNPAPPATATSSVSKQTVMEAQDLIVAGSIGGAGGGAAAARAASSADGPPRRNPNHKGPFRPGGCPCCDPLGNEIDNILAGKGWY